MQEKKKRWLAALLVLGLISIIGLFMPTTTNALSTGGEINLGDTAWMLTATGLVLLMTPGLSYFYGGMVRPKNVISTMLQSFIAMGVVSVLWVLVGFSLAFGESLGGQGFGIIGNPLTFLFFQNVGANTHPNLSPTIPLALFALFQMKFAIITPALITGSFAERVRFSAYLLFMVLFTLFIYTPLAHWTWHPNGFLRNWGVLDFAGGTVVHMSAGFAALAGAIFLGKRNENQPHLPANIPFVLLGTGMLWFGWFGFNAGSALGANGAAAMAFLNTNTASAAAMIAWVFLDGARGRKPSAMGACIGAVVGLVAVTPAAGFISVGASLFIGIVASMVSNIAVHWKERISLDDTLDVFACHGLGGITGMILTAILANESALEASRIEIIGFHFLGLLIVGVFTFGGSFLLYKITNFFVPMRVRDEQELIGLDLSQHNETLHTENGNSNGNKTLHVTSY